MQSSDGKRGCRAQDGGGSLRPEQHLELAGAPLYVSSLFGATALIIAVTLSVRSKKP